MNSTTMNCILFVVITYLLTCILAWSWSLPPEYLGYLGPLAMLIPGSVAILLTAYNKRKVRDLFKLSSLKNCLLGFIMPMLAVMLSNCLLSPIVGYTFTLEKVKDFSIAMILFSLLFSFIFGNIVALGEEIGWRGYLLKNLKSQIPNFYVRAIVVGLIWAIWHMPLGMVQGPSFGGLTFPIVCVSILAFCAMSIMFTWLFEKDNSVWPVTVTHATNNFMAGTIPILFTTMSFPLSTSTVVISTIFRAVVYFVIVMGVIWFDRKCCVGPVDAESK